MACESISVALQVDPPSVDTEIVFQLDRTCNPGDTAEWKLHFELKEKNAAGALADIVKLDIDVHHADHPAAAATAKNGLDANQRAQAAIAGQTALAIQTSDATADDVKDQASQVIPSRDPASPV